jgi:hypothetical protein
MAPLAPKRYSLDFGKKEKVLNYTCQTYQLSRPSKVGAVMALIRQCHPQSIEEWETWYFEHATTEGRQALRVTPEVLRELGERLYEKIIGVVIPEWEAAFRQLTQDDCIAYIHNLTIRRTYDGYLREKSVVYDGLANRFPSVRFEESPSELDHAGDVDYLGFVNSRAFGIQIKPSTAKANFGNYSVSERMHASFASFTNQFSGRVFIIFSLDGEIGNPEILPQIEQEIARLRSL